MKRISIFLVIVGILSVSCKNLLNKQPQAAISTSNAYQTSEDAIRAVTAAYRPLESNAWFGPSYGGYMTWVFGDIASDNAVKGGESASDQSYAYAISHFTVTPTNLATNLAWSTLYVGIHRCNLVLDNVPNIKMDGTLKTRLLNEAHFLRGFYYFQLVKLFGGVPLVLKSTYKSYDMAKSPKSDVYAQIIKDLQAAEGLPMKSQYDAADMGRATKGAAEAYLGKVYLYMHDFPKAEAEFKKVVEQGQYSLDPNYLNMFRLSDQHGVSSIFEVDYQYSTKYSVENRGNVIRGSRAMYGWGFVCPTQDFVDAFSKGDPRKKLTVYQNGDTLSDGKIADVGNSPTGYLSRKWYLPSSDFPPNGSAISSGRDELLMRYAKVLLWYAEAANEDQNYATALKYLNQVRARARALSSDPNVLPDITTTNQDSLRQIIYHEERVEYGTEHERFFDLVRTGRAATTLHNFAQKYNTQKGANFKQGKNEIFPIPQSDIDLSHGKLVQNPGYNQ